MDGQTPLDVIGGLPRGARALDQVRDQRVDVPGDEGALTGVELPVGEGDRTEERDHGGHLRLGDILLLGEDHHAATS